MAFECSPQQVKELAGYLDNGDSEFFHLIGGTVFKYPQSTGSEFGNDLASLRECMHAIDAMEQKGTGLDILRTNFELNSFELTDDDVRCGKKKPELVQFGTD